MAEVKCFTDRDELLKETPMSLQAWILDGKVIHIDLPTDAKQIPHWAFARATRVSYGDRIVKERSPNDSQF